MKRREHPSGRPIRERDVKRYGFYRVPYEGPLNPRLRVKENDLSLVGFTSRITVDDGYDDE